MKFHLIRKLFNKSGYDITRIHKEKTWPVDFEDWHKIIIQKAEPFTMTSRERMYGLIEAVKYIVHHNIEGDVVECGVWRGGSMLATAEALEHFNSTSRNLYLYDTYEGMPPPTDDDVSYADEKAEKMLKNEKDKEDSHIWATSSLERVKQTLSLSNYPSNLVHYIKGKVEDTIPGTIPQRIALLRLDTDWYESTKHELIHLYPRLVKGGVLIIDDYGFWKGARKAVDEYFRENNVQILLNRMDDTGRIAVKME